MNDTDRTDPWMPEADEHRPSNHLVLGTKDAYGVRVVTNVPMEALRRSQCLCLNCIRCYPEGDEEPCVAAAEGLRLCKNYAIAFMVTRCGSFVRKCWQ